MSPDTCSTFNIGLTICHVDPLMSMIMVNPLSRTSLLQKKNQNHKLRICNTSFNHYFFSKYKLTVR